MKKLTKWEERRIKHLYKFNPNLSLRFKEIPEEERASYIEEYLKKEKLLFPERITLQDVHDLYNDLLYIEDEERIDVVLATALSSKLDGIPIWLILVGASGDMKSAQINAIRTNNTFILHNLTSKTLVNGYKDKKENPDLAPELNGKIILIPDMAQILKLPPVEKAELWGQLRDLYDGLAGKISGMGARARYENIRTTLIAGSTPSIDGQILIHQDLGTRELVFRTYGNKNKELVMEKCLENEEWEDKIKYFLKEMTSKFLEQKEVKRIELSKSNTEQIKKIAKYTTYMRASADIDSYTNTLRGDVFPEEPTRILKQLKRLFICLMSLEDNYPEKRALNIIKRIGIGSGFPLRIKIFELLLNDSCEYSTTQISELLHLGKSTTQRELNVLWNLDLVKCRKQETKIPDKFYDYWQINQSHKFIKDIKDIKESLSFRPEK